MARGKASIEEVSRLSGVSIATVSRVVHQNGRFSKDTEKRVLQVMKELNYTPDRIAQGMRLKSMPVIGMIVPDILDDRYGLILRTAQKRLFEAGFSSFVFNSNEDYAQAQSFIDSMAGQHASGLIYVPDSTAAFMDLHGLPTVFLERRPSFTVDVPHVQFLMNDRDCARNAMALLLKSGRRNVVLLGDRMGISSCRERITGAVEALNAAGLEPVSLIPLNPHRSSEAISAFGELLDRDIPVDSVFCVSVRLTVGVMSVLKTRGISREQIDVMGIGEHRLCKYGLIDYHSVNEPLEEMALEAADTIIAMANGEAISVPEKVFDCDIMH